jgi:hypothetical protein
MQEWTDRDSFAKVNPWEWKQHKEEEEKIWFTCDEMQFANGVFPCYISVPLCDWSSSPKPSKDI